MDVLALCGSEPAADAGTLYKSVWKVKSETGQSEGCGMEEDGGPDKCHPLSHTL